MRFITSKDIDVLAKELGYSAEKLAKLEESGEVLLQLQRDWRKRQSQPRLLHRDSTRGYTDEPTLALIGSAEEVSEEDQHRFTAEARAKEQDVATLAQAHREQLTLAQRLSDMRADARERKVDVSKDERVILSRLRAIEQRLRVA